MYVDAIHVSRFKALLGLGLKFLTIARLFLLLGVGMSFPVNLLAPSGIDKTDTSRPDMPVRRTLPAFALAHQQQKLPAAAYSLSPPPDELEAPPWPFRASGSRA
jgi:hypothetical protein